MKLIVSNVNTKIKFNKNEKSRERRNILRTLNYKLNPHRPFYYRSRAYRIHVWDGRIKIVDVKHCQFPTGLLQDVYKVLLGEQQYYQDLQVKIVDNRAQTIKPEVPNQMVIGGHKLRDYQLDGIKKAITDQRVVINTATNSGKTSIAAGIIKVALNALDDTDDILMFTQSKDVTKQDHDSLEKDIGVPVGMLGGGYHITHQITCATARTLSSALKDPAKKVHITSRKDKILQYMATKYVPKFLYNYNKGKLIRAYINTHIPRYSYDQACYQQLASFATASDAKIYKILKSYVHEYHKMLFNKNKSAFTKYKNMVDYLNNVKLVFVDEAQHAPAASFRKALSFMPNARMRVAMTGTVPSEKIKHAWFIAEFGHHTLKVSNHTLIKRGISAIPLVTKVPINAVSDYQGHMFDLAQKASSMLPLDIPKNSQSIMLSQLQNKLGIVFNKYRNEVIARLAVKLYKAENGVDLIVVNFLDQGKLIADAIYSLDKDINVQFLQGADDNDTRNKILKDTKAGKVDVLIATQVINEGLNIPNLANMIYASAGKSSVELLQRVGRLLRKYPKQKYVYIFDIFDKTSDMLYKQSMQRLKIYKQQKFQIMN